MNKKYPVLKCTDELWKEIKPVLESFGITNFSNIGDGKDLHFGLYPFLVTNYGQHYNDIFLIGNTDNQPVDNYSTLRYLVDTKEEFLLGVAKLLNKEYKMERNIKVSLEKAREWYKSEGTLREIALQAFTKDELEALPTLEEIFDRVVKNTPSCLVVPTKETLKWTIMHRLAVVAEYLNNGWRPDWTNNNEAKYYIFKDFQLKEIQIATTYSCSNGCVYFKTKELAEAAIKIIGKDIDLSF